MHDEGKRLRIMRAEQEVAIARGIDPLQHTERGEHFLEQPPERNRAPIGLRQELMRRRETAQSRLKRGDEVPRLRPVLAAHADDAADHGQHVLHAMGELLVEQLSRLLLLPPRGDVEAKPGETSGSPSSSRSTMQDLRASQRTSPVSRRLSLNSWLNSRPEWNDARIASLNPGMSERCTSLKNRSVGNSETSRCIPSNAQA